MLKFFIEIIQVALDDLKVDPPSITEVEIEPYLNKSYWLDFNNFSYYACVTMICGELVVWVSGQYPAFRELER